MRLFSFSALQLACRLPDQLNKLLFVHFGDVDRRLGTIRL
jgi:hypothetical protein